MPALQQFFRDERLRRGWSVREAAQRSQISPSKAYAIENGDDNVEFETFENIATAFGMTPARLAAVIGKGDPDISPKRAAIIALIHSVPDEELATVDRVVRPFAVEPIRPQPNRPKRAKANREIPHSVEMERDMPHGGEFGPGGGIAPWYREVTVCRPVRLGRLAHAS